jgi:hypothetical protein
MECSVPESMDSDLLTQTVLDGLDRLLDLIEAALAENEPGPHPEG